MKKEKLDKIIDRIYNKALDKYEIERVYNPISGIQGIYDIVEPIVKREKFLKSELKSLEVLECARKHMNDFKAYSDGVYEWSDAYGENIDDWMLKPSVELKTILLYCISDKLENEIK